MKVQGFVGGSFELDFANVDCQRTVNLYPEVIQSGTGKEAQQAYLKPTPGLQELFEVGDGPIRMIFECPDGTYIIASGGVLHWVGWDGATLTNKTTKSLTTSSGPVRASASIVENGTIHFQVVIVDGAINYAGFLFVVSGYQIATFSSLSYPGAPSAIDVLGLDGYFIYIIQNSNKFYTSDIYSLAVDPLNFASAEGDPDSVMAGMIIDRNLVLVNGTTAEIWTNTGNADFPFERANGGVLASGTFAKYSASHIDGKGFWLTRTKSGKGTIVMLEGLRLTTISTFGLEQKIASYANPENATAYTYSDGSHIFYVINFDEMSWCYDLSTQQWHERAYTENGVLGRHRADVLTFSQELSYHMCGDYENNKVYMLNPNKRTDNGQAITRLRRFPHMSASGKNIFNSSLLIDMKTGVGINEITQGHDPKLMMRFSNDGGRTFSNERTTSMGKIGSFKTRVKFERLGMARDRVYEIKVTDPVDTVFVAAEIQAEVGSR